MVSNDWLETSAIDPLAQHCRDVVDKTWNAFNRCRDAQDHFMNAAMGLAGEAGEVLDVHKKLFFHRPKNRDEELIEELGDTLYYLAKVLDLHNLTLAEVLESNKRKLFKRYEVTE